MRLTALLLLLSVFINTYGQRSSSGTYNINGRCFNKASYTLNYSFSKDRIQDNGLNFVVKANLNISFRYPNDAVFTLGEKSYTLSNLGLSQWPQTDQNMGLQLKVAVYHGNTFLFRETYETGSVQIGHQFVEKTYSTAEQKTVKEEIFFRAENDGPKLKNFSIENCRIEVEGIYPILCPSFATELSNKISSQSNSVSTSSSTSTGSNSTPTNGSSSSTYSSSSSSSIYSPETVALVSTAVDAGISFFDGLAANARAKRERKINDKLEAAEGEVKRRNLENCNTPECNTAKGDIYRDASAEGMKGLSFRSTYTYELWKIAEAYYIKAAAENNTNAMESLISYYRFSTNKSNDMVKYWLDRLIPLFEAEAKKGKSFYMYKLARIYDNTYNSYSKQYEDNAKGIYWYDQAAQKGDEDSQERLMEVYKDGKMDQKKDYVKALKYANDLFNNDNATLDEKKKAQKEIIDIYKDGGNGINKNDQLAKEWKSKVPDFVERFYNNLNDWANVNEQDYEAGIRNQRYMLHIKKPDTRASVIEIPCYQDRDYVITARVRKLEGSDDVVFGLILGADKKLDKYHSLCMTAGGSCYLYRSSGTNTVLISDKPASFVKGNEYNIVSLRKIGSKFKMYINSSFVGECGSEYFFGEKFGFLVLGKDNNFKMDVDYLMIRELKPDQPVESSSAPTNSSTNITSTNTSSALVYAENFNDNQHQWFEKETEQYSIKLQNGKYRIHSNGGSWISSIPVEFDQSRNYEISVNMTKVEGTDAYYFGVMLGRDVNTGYHHLMGITGSGYYVFANKGANPEDVSNFQDIRLVNPGNATNNLKLRKIGNAFELFINNKPIRRITAQNLYGNTFGFQVWSGNEKLTVDFDDLIIKYID